MPQSRSPTRSMPRSCSASWRRSKRATSRARMPLDWTGVAGKVADGLNDVIVANQALGAELARVSRVVGQGGQALAASRARRMDPELVGQRRVGQQPDRRPRATDERDAARHRRRRRRRPEQEGLGRRPRRDARAEEHDQRHGRPAQRFISEVTRVAREVGTEGKLGQAAAVTIEVGGVWKDLTDNVNLMAGNLTGQVRNIAEVTTAVANGDLSKKISIDVKGEFLELKNTVNAMVDQLNALRRRGDASRPRGRRRGQARRPGAVEGGRRRLEGPHRQRQPAGGQPDQPGARDRRGGHRRHRGRPDPAGASGGQRRGRRAQGQAQRDDPQPARDDASRTSSRTG